MVYYAFINFNPKSRFKCSKYFDDDCDGQIEIYIYTYMYITNIIT